MDNSILNIENQDFIEKNIDKEISTLLFKKIPDNLADKKQLIEQIEAKKKCKNKLPTWYNTPLIYYPNKLNIEQTSSEITAKYKSTLVSGNTIIDVTGGFGVDCFYFSRVFKKVIHCEINTDLSNYVTHNFKQLKVDAIECISSNGIQYIKQGDLGVDCIYIDPSRRHDKKGKVFMLGDCLPNVPEHLDILFKRSNLIMIKTSPLLDITIGRNELNHVKEIHCVAVNNEVKELLWILENGFEGAPEIKTINLLKNSTQAFNFKLNKEQKALSQYNKPLTYLYEPNSAILKSGAFNCVSEQLNLFKLHKHSHLYTSKTLIEFPGRCFKVENIVPYNKSEFKKHFKQAKANVTTRNFPETVKQIRKKLSLKDGGNDYLFFTTLEGEKKAIICCSKIDCV